MRDARARAVFVLSAIVLAVLYGTEAGRSNWFPNPQISLAMTTVQDVSRYWQNDLGLKPTRHLVPARNPGRPKGDTGFRILRPDEIEPGYVAIAGLSAEQKRSAFSVTLYDMAGKVLHVWPVNYRALDPTGPGGLNVMIHGMELFSDGSIAVAFDEGRVMARLDACGRAMWISKGAYSHSVVSDGQGHLVSWRNYKITWLDAATGKKIRELGLLKQIIPQGGDQLGIFSILSHVYSESGKVQYLVDPFHPNSVKPLVPAMAAAFPEFKVGDLLISLREPDLVAVIDPVTGHVKWWQNGPWYKQHDPEFEADGTITVYDNHPSSGVSRIVKVDPKTHGTTVLFQGSKQIPFYSWQRGKHQVLTNGNILITEPEHGRVFEVDAQGRLVWEREMVWDSNQNLIVTEARHLAPDFYTHGLPTCAMDGK
ncbi:arylsulfotransferase family protein [Solirhodobacter olei]|uniref:arylsulfotransferase family protein n=1 Tax=Solirhodobacter olei TaxID=2493082 RepID=UPI000FD8F4C5|nr:arylsulfotransferase family protein [Solirhodobacter olei]